MCGISGIIGPAAKEHSITAMVAAQRHRGPDDDGIYLEASDNLALGHNRLSIIDLSRAGHQPMLSDDGNLVIVFNGEIYNYRELRSELPKRSYRGLSDTEVLLAAFQKWGHQCVDHLIGIFSFAIWDKRSRSLFCARDRLGIKPFHWTKFDGSFFFASEIKGILAAGVSSSPNWQCWGDYLAHGYYDHDTNSFFKNIESLPPAHAMTIRRDGKTKIWQYWSVPDRTQEIAELRDQEAAEQLHELLKNAVQLRLRSDVPVAVNLSGGLDSSSLLATIDDIRTGDAPLQRFTVIYGDNRYDEDSFASGISLSKKSSQITHTVNPSTISVLMDKAINIQEAPIGGIATLAYQDLHRRIAEAGIKVVIEGQGVDEILAGYNYFRAAYHGDLLRKGECTMLRHEVRASADPAAELRALRQQIGGQSANTYQDGTSHLNLKTLSQDFLSFAQTPPSFPAPFKDGLRNALFRDLRYTKLPRVLRMNDRLSMAHGIELREPFLDHRIVEYAFRLPAHQRIRQGNSKWLLRQAMRKRLPPSICFAAKRAVVTPQREWLAGPLRDWMEDTLRSQAFTNCGLFNVAAVQKSLQHFYKEGANNTFFIWQWINTAIWFNRYASSTKFNQ